MDKCVALDEVVAAITADPEHRRALEAFVHWVGRFVERRGGQKMPMTTKLLLGALIWRALEGGGGFADVVRALKEDAEVGRSEATRVASDNIGHPKSSLAREG